ncbi:unnamed protein product, partial [Owenia fusiformis]
MTSTQLARNRLGKSSQDFAQEIKKLEMEGSRLMSERQRTSVGRNSPGIESSGHDTLREHEEAPWSPYKSSSMSVLGEITSDNRIITDLRNQLESQSVESKRLQEQLLRETVPLPSFTTDALFRSSQKNVSFSDNRHTDILPHTEKALRESQKEVAELTVKNTELARLSEEQKQNFRKAIEDLKSKLHDAVVGRDSVIKLREKESANQDILIQKLQTTLHQLQEANAIQEETLLDMNTRMDVTQKEHYKLETMFDQIRTFLRSIESKRGRPYFENEPIDGQGSSMVLHILERCIHEFEGDLDTNRAKINQMEKDYEDMSDRSRLKHEELITEYGSNIARMEAEHNIEITKVREKLIYARKQVSDYEAEIVLIKDKHSQQVNMKDENIKELEARIQHVREELAQQEQQWKLKREALESGLSSTESDIIKVRLDRDEAIQKMAAIESRNQDYEQTIRTLQDEIEVSTEQLKECYAREDDFKMRLEKLTKSLEERDVEIRGLQHVVRCTKEDAKLQMENKVALVEQHEKDRATEQLNILTTQLSSQTEKVQALTVEKEVAQTELKSYKEKYYDVSDKCDDLKLSLEAVREEKGAVDQMLNEKTEDYKSVLKERDYYFNLLEERNTEIDQLKTDIDRLDIKLDERERNLEVIKRQNENMSQMVSINTRAAGDTKTERDKLQQFLDDKIAELEELKHSRDACARKLKIRERKIRELESQKGDAEKQLQEKMEDFDLIKEEKDAIFRELRDSRVQVDGLLQERENLTSLLDTKEEEMIKQLSKVNSKLKATEHDLKLARRTLKAKESSDGNAVRVADKMQQEVTTKRGELDSLQSQHHWLQEKLEAAAKDKKAYKDELEKCRNDTKKVNAYNHQLSTELEAYIKKNQQLREKISQLEASLEKAGSKYSSAQAKLEEVEQEMTRLKLHHQLEIKELQRTGQVAVKGEPHVSQLPHQDNPNQLSIASTDYAMHYGMQKEKPVSQKQSKEHSSNVEAGVGEELKGILDEMRSLLNTQKTQKAAELHKNLKIERVTSDGTSGTEVDSNYHASRRSKHYLKQGPSYSMSPPVKLLPREDHGKIPTWENHGKSRSHQHGSSGHTPLHKKPDTKELCRRLEQKIENLSKMGGSLQQENIEMAALIKDQGKKIKRARD